MEIKELKVEKRRRNLSKEKRFTSLLKETRKISSKQSKLTPKETRERRTNKTQS